MEPQKVDVVSCGPQDEERKTKNANLSELQSLFNISKLRQDAGSEEVSALNFSVAVHMMVTSLARCYRPPYHKHVVTSANHDSVFSTPCSSD